MDPSISSSGVQVREIEDGWSEASPLETCSGETQLRNVFCEQVMRSGIWAAVVHISSAKDDREGGIFVGIAPDGCSTNVPLGDRDAGIGWGKAMPYAHWNDMVASSHPSNTYPFYPQKSRVRMQQRHYLFDYSVEQVGTLLSKWGYGHYKENFRQAGVDGLKLLAFASRGGGALEHEVGMSGTESTDLVAKIGNYFKGVHAYKRNDVIRLLLNLDAVEPTLTFFRRGVNDAGETGWLQIGRPISLKNISWNKTGWRFAVTLNSPLDLVHMCTTQGAGEHPPRIPRKQNSRQKNDSVGAGGSANVGGKNKKSNSIYVSPSGGGGRGSGASSCLRQGKELPEGSLANWRFYRGTGAGAFSAIEFVILYNIYSGVVVELAAEAQTTVVLQAVLPPHKGAGANISDMCDAFRAPSASASRHVLSLNTSGVLSASAWRAPNLIDLVLSDFAAVSLDPSSAQGAVGGKESVGGWERGEGCTTVSRRRLGGGVKGRLLFGADEGVEWAELGVSSGRRASTDHPPTAGMVVVKPSGDGDASMRMSLNLTSAGLIGMFAGGLNKSAAVMALNGLAVRYGSLEEAHELVGSLRAVYRPPIIQGLEALRAAQGGRSIQARPAQIRDLLQGDPRARGIRMGGVAGVAADDAYGADARLDFRLAPRRAWVAETEAAYRVAPRSGKSVMDFWDSERKLREKEALLNFKLKAVQEGLAQLPAGLSGHNLRAEERKLEKKVARAVWARSEHTSFAQQVQRSAKARLRVGGTGRERDGKERHGRERDATWSARPRSAF